MNLPLGIALTVSCKSFAMENFCGCNCNLKENFHDFVLNVICRKVYTSLSCR